MGAKTTALNTACPALYDISMGDKLNAIIDLVNDLKAKYDAAVTLMNELKADHNAHLAAASMHYDGTAGVTDTVNTVAAANAAVTAKAAVPVLE